MDKSELNKRFFEAYHNENMGNSVKSFLKDTFPTMADNRHVSSMMHFCNLISERGTDDVFPAVFGMLCEAWKQFLAELMVVHSSKLE